MNYMKLLINFVLIILLINLQSCSRHLVPSQSISATSYSEYEITYFVVTSGKNRSDAMKNASMKVFENIFYIGTPGSINNLPMLDGSRNQTQSFFLKFVDNEQYKPFVTSITETSYSNTDNITKAVKLETKMVVNIECLRRNLEREGIIRKFGY